MAAICGAGSIREADPVTVFEQKAVLVMWYCKAVWDVLFTSRVSVPDTKYPHGQWLIPLFHKVMGAPSPALGLSAGLENHIRNSWWDCDKSQWHHRAELHPRTRRLLTKSLLPVNYLFSCLCLRKVWHDLRLLLEFPGSFVCVGHKWTEIWTEIWSISVLCRV